jgi:hypothetical protein
MASFLAWESNLINDTSKGLIPLESGLFYAEHSPDAKASG